MFQPCSGRASSGRTPSRSIASLASPARLDHSDHHEGDARDRHEIGRERSPGAPRQHGEEQEQDAEDGDDRAQPILREVVQHLAPECDPGDARIQARDQHLPARAGRQRGDGGHGGRQAEDPGDVELVARAAVDRLEELEQRERQQDHREGEERRLPALQPARRAAPCERHRVEDDARRDEDEKQRPVAPVAVLAEREHERARREHHPAEQAQPVAPIGVEGSSRGPGGSRGGVGVHGRAE